MRGESLNLGSSGEHPTPTPEKTRLARSQSEKGPKHCMLGVLKKQGSQDYSVSKGETR